MEVITLNISMIYTFMLPNILANYFNLKNWILTYLCEFNFIFKNYLLKLIMKYDEILSHIFYFAKIFLKIFMH